MVEPKHFVKHPMKVLFLLLVLAATVIKTNEQNPSCPDGMQYSSCGSACPLTCLNKDDTTTVCPAICVSGCFCPSGKALIDDDMCIEPSLCPNSTELLASINCTDGLVYRQCGSLCNVNVTCEERDSPSRSCPTICVPGCFCPSDDSVLYNNTCIQCSSSAAARESNHLPIFSLLLLLLPVTLL